MDITLTSKSLSHNGIKIFLIGQIENTVTTIKKITQFISLSKDLAPPGTITQQVARIPFSFSNVELAYESYLGIRFNVRYILKVTIAKSIRSLSWENEFGVVHPKSKEILEICNPEVKMEIGIEDWLRLSFVLDKKVVSTKGICTGKVIFKRATMKLKSMILQIIRKETVIGGDVDNAVLCRYEIMDGAPMNNEEIPIRFFLSPYELTPTYDNVNNKFSVKYYINLVLFDTSDERYFKQSEIILVRIPRVPVKK